ncbi:hypothetical protein M8818_001912 [Zalaria obscura]|uniref:Uncharacterized protein n=1 Tax=Zalaria obscura TaxID=2024903 RepID=A0ACC3SIH1_9PEZI
MGKRTGRDLVTNMRIASDLIPCVFLAFQCSILFLDASGTRNNFSVKREAHWACARARSASHAPYFPADAALKKSRTTRNRPRRRLFCSLCFASTCASCRALVGVCDTH